ncbi:hemicentin-2-like isoform X2 [Ruditapes philippinarum]|nr:hemicentin-2-like isoform X2 [Ruditapes philippinarum]
MLSRGYKMVRYNKQMKVEKPGFGEFELNILKLTRRFADTYKCRTTNGTILSEVTVALEHTPTIEEDQSSPAHVIIREHSLVELKCIFSGLPEPDIVWHRGSTQKLIEGIKGPKLIIRNVPRYASDNYTCKATNDRGFKEKSIQLTVQFLPEVSVMESVIHVAPSEAVTMGCAIQASPMKETFWINSKGLRIKTDWKYEVLEEEENDNFPVRFLELRIKEHRISVHDKGNYTCHAEGENGGTNETVLLVVNT